MAQLNCQLSPWGREASSKAMDALSHVSWGLSTWHYNECPAQFGQLAKQLPIGQLSQFMRIQSVLTVAMFLGSALQLQQQKHVQKQKLQIAKHCKSHVIYMAYMFINIFFYLFTLLLDCS